MVSHSEQFYCSASDGRFLKKMPNGVSLALIWRYLEHGKVEITSLNMFKLKIIKGSLKRQATVNMHDHEKLGPRTDAVLLH